MSDEFDTWNTEAIKCPYCGFVDHDTCEYRLDDTTYLCGSCDRESDLCVNISITYSTKQKAQPVPATKENR